MIGVGPLWCSVTVQPDAVVDGDTLRVQATAPQSWGAYLGRLRLDGAGAVSVRLAALDAPERHYPGAPGGWDHQPLEAARQAERALVVALGEALPCRLSARVHGVDRYGRALAVLWRPDAAPWPATGADLDVEPDAWARSVNACLLANGVAYPDFHPGLPTEALARLTQLVAAARGASLGVWASDQTARGFALADLGALCRDCLILPRLFRRLADFHSLQVRSVRHPFQEARLREFLEQREVAVRLRSGGPVRPFAEFLEIADGRARIREPVENFLYQSGDTAQKLT